MTNEKNTEYTRTQYLQGFQLHHDMNMLVSIPIWGVIWYNQFLVPIKDPGFDDYLFSSLFNPDT
jgi:hypothetical protein